jgi:hypothetical protein
LVLIMFYICQRGEEGHGGVRIEGVAEDAAIDGRRDCGRLGEELCALPRREAMMGDAARQSRLTGKH